MKISLPLKSHSLFRLSLVLLTIFSATAGYYRSQAGTIIGTVRAEANKQVEQETSAGKYESRKFKFAERVNYAELRDFVVYIDGPSATKVTPPEKPVQVVTTRIVQQGAVFTPRVMPILVGTTVEWPNHDEIYHNVFSISETKPFDLGLYKDPEIKRVTFDKPGRVDVFCSIHAAMNCIILVLENPHFAVADPKGKYTIRDLPAGTYKLRAWHERMPGQVKEVIVPERGEAKVDFILTVTALPKY